MWGIASGEPPETLEIFVEQHGLTFPILLDYDGSVNHVYALNQAFSSAAYPQDWVIGSDGVIVYSSNSFELDAMERVLEAELAR